MRDCKESRSRGGMTVFYPFPGVIEGELLEI